MADNDKKFNPNSPLIASAEGANKDQVKMVGTEAAKEGEDFLGLKAAKKTPQQIMQPDTAFKEREKRRFEQKEGVKGELDKNPLLQNAGNAATLLKMSVSNNIDQIYDEERERELMPEGEEEAGKIFSDPNDEKVKEFGQIFEVKEDGSPKTGAEINEELGNWGNKHGFVDTDGKVKLSWDDINQLVPEVEGTVSNAVALGLADNIIVDDRFLSDLGYTVEEASEFKDILGLTGNETFDEFQKSFQGYKDREALRVESLVARLRDPQLSAGERGELLSNLRDMGYTGTLASTEELRQINRQVQEADQGIEFLGKTFDSIEEALSDDHVTNEIANYLRGGNEGENLPTALKEIVDNNRDTFNKIVEDLKLDVEEFGDIQAEWEKYSSPEIQAASDWAGMDTKGAFKTERPENIPNTLKSAADGNMYAKRVLSSTVDRLGADVSQDIKNSVLNLSDAELYSIATDPERLDTFTNNLETQDKFDDYYAMPEEERAGLSTSDVASKLLGFEDTDEFEQLIQSAELLEFMGDPSAAGILDAMEEVWTTDSAEFADRLNSVVADGKLLNPKTGGTIFADIKDRLKDIQEMAGSGKVAIAEELLNETGDTVENIKILSNPKDAGEWRDAYDMMEGIYGADGASKYYDDVWNEAVKLDEVPEVLTSNAQLYSAGKQILNAEDFLEGARYVPEQLKGVLDPVFKEPMARDWKMTLEESNQMVGALGNVTRSQIPTGTEDAFIHVGKDAMGMDIYQMKRVRETGAGRVDAGYNKGAQDFQGMLSSYVRSMMANGVKYGRELLVDAMEAMKTYQTLGGKLYGQSDRPEPIVSLGAPAAGGTKKAKPKPKEVFVEDPTVRGGGYMKPTAKPEREFVEDSGVRGGGYWQTVPKKDDEYIGRK